VVDDPIDGRRCGHGVLENPVPLGEHQIRSDDDASTFITFREQGEQNLRLVTGLLNVTYVVDLC